MLGQQEDPGAAVLQIVLQEIIQELAVQEIHHQHHHLKEIQEVHHMRHLALDLEPEAVVAQAVRG
jgi:hypothetical protein